MLSTVKLCVVSYEVLCPFAFGFSLGLEALDRRDSNRLRKRRKVDFSLGLETLDRGGSDRLMEREKVGESSLRPISQQEQVELSSFPAKSVTKGTMLRYNSGWATWVSYVGSMKVTGWTLLFQIFLAKEGLFI